MRPLSLWHSARAQTPPPPGALANGHGHGGDDTPGPWNGGWGEFTSWVESHLAGRQVYTANNTPSVYAFRHGWPLTVYASGPFVCTAGGRSGRKVYTAGPLLGGFVGDGPTVLWLMVGKAIER